MMFGLIAEQEWTQQKEEFLKTIAEDKREGIEAMLDKNPEKLNDIKLWTEILTSSIEQAGGTVVGIKKPEQTEKRKPSGRVPMIPKQQYEKDSDAKDWISGLYEVLKDPSKTKQEKREANRMVDELFMSIIKGFNVAKRRTGRRFGDWQLWECPSCRRVIKQPRGLEPDNCPACGWKLWSREAVITQ